MGTKKAWIMLAIIVLWTALPGLACLSPTPHQDCCKQMMKDCESSMAMADPSCCKVHSSDQNVPPAQTAPPSDTGVPAHIYLAVKFDLPLLDSVTSTPVTETPPRAASGRIPILRI